MIVNPVLGQGVVVCFGAHDRVLAVITKVWPHREAAHVATEDGAVCTVSTTLSQGPDAAVWLEPAKGDLPMHSELRQRFSLPTPQVAPTRPTRTDGATFRAGDAVQLVLDTGSRRDAIVTGVRRGKAYVVAEGCGRDVDVTSGPTTDDVFWLEPVTAESEVHAALRSQHGVRR